LIEKQKKKSENSSKWWQKDTKSMTQAKRQTT